MANYVPMNKWGCDHWSTLAYIETRCVDHKGHVMRQHLRADPKRHPDVSHLRWYEDIPTFLKNDEKLPQHDDWDCIEDAIQAGLLIRVSRFEFKMTPEGERICAWLRQHKARGGSFKNFDPEE